GQLQDLVGGSGKARSRNLVVRKRRAVPAVSVRIRRIESGARHRIEDGRRRPGKVSSAHRRRWNIEVRLRVLPLRGALVADEEKRLVPFDRPSNCSTELVIDVLRLIGSAITEIRIGAELLIKMI